MPAGDLNGLRRGGQRVIELLAYGQAVLPNCKLLALDQHRLPSMLWRYREDDAFAELVTPIQRIQAKDSNGQLLRTLRSWCKHYGQPQQCADALAIHRNSLRYRLERVSELSGKDLSRLDELLELYLGLQLVPDQELAE
ncbi:Carbohydrate diacid regulator [compost metagenome]